MLAQFHIYRLPIRILVRSPGLAGGAGSGIRRRGADGFGGGGLFAGGGGGGYSGGGGARPPVWVAVAARLTPVCPHSGGRFPGWRRRAHNHRACARGARALVPGDVRNRPRRPDRPHGHAASIKGLKRGGVLAHAFPLTRWTAVTKGGGWASLLIHEMK